MNAIRRELRFLREAAESDPEPFLGALLTFVLLIAALCVVLFTLSPP